MDRTEIVETINRMERREQDRRKVARQTAERRQVPWTAEEASGGRSAAMDADVMMVRLSAPAA